MTSAPERPPANALPADQEWCGHAMVDLSAWRCAACHHPVPEATRRRMVTAPTRARPGHVWVLTEGPGAAYGDDYPGGAVVGVFSDRAKIARLLVRGSLLSAASLRKQRARITWYQGAFNPDVLEGWGTDEDGAEVNYDLALVRIDHP